MVLQMFPSFLGMTAIYVICLSFGLTDNIYTLVVLYVGGAIPYNVWLVRGFMLNIPKSLDEAAFIDGATKLQVFMRVVFPLSVPLISFLAVTAFMAPWMDYILPRLLLSANENRTLAIGLFEMADPANTARYDITAFSAGCIIVGLPIAMLYMVFQRFLLTGLTAGANKGE
jgi:arabinogalactan oligomer/maltooligosaccharide transport system permease protein